MQALQPVLENAPVSTESDWSSRICSFEPGRGDDVKLSVCLFQAGVEFSDASIDIFGRASMSPWVIGQMPSPPLWSPSMAVLNPTHISHPHDSNFEQSRYEYWRHRQHLYLPCLRNESRREQQFWFSEYPVSFHLFNVTNASEPKRPQQIRYFHEVVVNGAVCFECKMVGYQPKTFGQ